MLNGTYARGLSANNDHMLVKKNDKLEVCNGTPTLTDTVRYGILQFVAHTWWPNDKLAHDTIFLATTKQQTHKGVTRPTFINSKMMQTCQLGKSKHVLKIGAHRKLSLRASKEIRFCDWVSDVSEKDLTIIKSIH